MPTVQRLELVLQWARQLGYHVRHEYLGGAGGGCCRVGEREILFVDLALSASEQLDQVVDALRQERHWHSAALPEPLRELDAGRRAA